MTTATETTTKERPILFSAPMVRAILNDQNPKTQTRRIVKADFHHDPNGVKNAKWYLRRPGWCWDSYETLDQLVARHCPYGKPGDRLWVRETWHLWGPPGRQFVEYAATCDEAADLKWKPSIHMPRAYSRISLEIAGVRVERLQDISDADIQAEGFPLDPPSYAEGLAATWNKINGDGAWEANPWVWVVGFKRI
jgi:hypothetical protein